MRCAAGAKRHQTSLSISKLRSRSVIMVLPVLERLSAEGDAACKWAMPEGGDTGCYFNAGRSCRCPDGSSAVAAVGHVGLYELPRQLNLLPADLQSFGAMLQMMCCDAALPEQPLCGRRQLVLC